MTIGENLVKLKKEFAGAGINILLDSFLGSGFKILGKKIRDIWDQL